MDLRLVGCSVMTSTRNAADAVAQLESPGTVDDGKWADLVVVTDNPTEDLCHRRLVRRGGAVAVNEVDSA